MSTLTMTEPQLVGCGGCGKGFFVALYDQRSNELPTEAFCVECRGGVRLPEDLDAVLSDGEVPVFLPWQQDGQEGRPQVALVAFFREELEGGE